ncbi:MAG TPA: hypothetical protein VFB89_14335 [Gemmatimonadales bacterium]|nr:hypothetical protein [Gemmatimonadales bacterium]
MRFGLILLLALIGARVEGQDRDLEREADRARRAWFDHDASALVANAPRLVIRLPGADPSGALGQAQAAALLRDFLAPSQEVETAVRSAEEVEPGRGYVELQRRYKVAGTQEVRSQTLLLAYRRGSVGWVLVELRVTT